MGKEMTTKGAFEALVSQPLWWRGLLDNSKKAADMKCNHKRNLVSAAMMEKLLIDAGYTVAQEKLWNKP